MSGLDRRRILEELGETGLQRFGGILTDEWLRELKGRKGLRIYREMRDNDPVIGSILFAIRQFMLTATFKVEPGGEGEQARRFADFVTENLDLLEIPFTPDFLIESMSFVVYGFAPFEILYRVENGWIYWRSFEIRPQETVERWEFDEKGRVLGMYQRLTNGQLVYIPIEKILLIKTEPAHGSPEGRSLLRNAYVPYYAKKHLQLLEAIGVERDLCGLPILFVPEHLFMDPKRRLEFQELVKNLRRDEESGLVFPWDPLEQKPIYRLEVLGTKAARQFSTSEIINRYNREIAQVLLADLVLVGAEARGSFALAREKRSMLELTVRGLLSSIVSAVNTQAIPRLLELNFGRVSRKLWPWITFTLPKVPNLSEIADLLSAYAKAGLPIDESTKAWLKEVLGVESGQVLYEEEGEPAGAEGE